MIMLSAMPEEQTASWLALLEIYGVLAHGWTLIGGQLVHLHCVLLPEGAGQRAKAREGVTGSPTLSTQGGTQALARSEVVAVTVDGREGFVRRPNLVGALVVKAAAHTNVGAHQRR